MSQQKPSYPSGESFVGRTLIVLAVVTLVILVLLGAWRVQSVVLLLFLWALLAVFLRGLSRPLTCVTRLPGMWVVECCNAKRFTVPNR